MCRNMIHLSRNRSIEIAVRMYAGFQFDVDPNSVDRASLNVDSNPTLYEYCLWLHVVCWWAMEEFDDTRYKQRENDSSLSKMINNEGDSIVPHV